MHDARRHAHHDVEMAPRHVRARSTSSRPALLDARAPRRENAADVWPDLRRSPSLVEELERRPILCLKRVPPGQQETMAARALNTGRKQPTTAPRPALSAGAVRCRLKFLRFFPDG